MPTIYCGEELAEVEGAKTAKGQPVYRPVGPLPYSYDRHGLIVGPTGCGKSTTFIMGNLLGDTLDDAGLILIDPKAELAAVTATHRAKLGPVYVIDPFGVLADLAGKHPKAMRELVNSGIVTSVGFNPFVTVEVDDPSFYDDCAAIAEALIKIEGNDPHWPESAQGLLTGLLMWEKIRYQETASLAHVRAMLTEPDRDHESGLLVHVRRIIEAHDDALGCEATGRPGQLAPSAVLEIAASLVARFAKPTDETRSILSTADTQTRWLLSPLVKNDLAKPGKDFRVLKDKPATFYVVLPSSRLRTHSVWLRLVIVTALRRLYIQQGTTRTLLFIDEMPALGYLPPLVDAFALVRGYNIGIIGIVQDLNQLKALYKDHWESFAANAGFMICWGPNDLTTSEWLSRRAGQKKQRNLTITDNRSKDFDPKHGSTGSNESFSMVPRQLPQDLIALPRDRVIVFFAGRSKGVFCTMLHYQQKHPGRGKFNPY